MEDANNPTKTQDWFAVPELKLLAAYSNTSATIVRTPAGICVLDHNAAHELAENILKSIPQPNPEKMSGTKQVIVVRKDLNMRKGKIGAQASHASRAFLSGKAEHPELNAWIADSQRTICLCINSEAELVALHEEALARRLVSHLITDHGLTEFKGVPTKTCLAIGPHSDEKFEGLTTDLQLF